MRILCLLLLALTGCQTKLVTVMPEIPPNDKLLPGLISLEGRGIYFKPGAKESEVLAVMGPPTSKNGNIWYYGDSTVTFSTSVAVPVVTGYHVRSTPLLIYDKDPFLWP